MSEIEKIKVRKFSKIFEKFGKNEILKNEILENSYKNFVQIVVSNVYWLMEIKLQIICLISFSGETIRSNYKNKTLFIFTTATILKRVGGSIAQRC